MTAAALPMVLDIIVILLLAGTIFYAVRLSSFLKAFRDSRADLERMIAELSAGIQRAEGAISGLRENARQSGRDLQEKINEARTLHGELEIISQSGDRLAGRLEQLADKTLRPKESATIRHDAPPRRAAPPEKRSKPPKPMASFAIRDPEFDESMAPDGTMAGDFEDDAAGGLADESGREFSSRAERDLYEALRRRKTEAGGVS